MQITLHKNFVMVRAVIAIAKNGKFVFGYLPLICSAFGVRDICSINCYRLNISKIIERDNVFYKLSCALNFDLSIVSTVFNNETKKRIEEAMWEYRPLYPLGEIVNGNL